jgi:amidase
MGFQPDDLPVPEAKPTRPNGPGTPFGLTFTSTAWTEEKLLGYAYAYEQATQTRLKRRAYDEAIPRTQLKDVIVSS